MSVFALTNATIHADGFDLSCVSNQVRFETSVAELDVTTFCSGGYRERIGGLRDASVDVSGFYEGDGIDDAVFDTLGSAKTAMSVTADDTEGSVAYVFRPMDVAYDILGAVGDAAPFSLAIRNRDSIGVARGQLIAAKQDVSSAGALSGYQVGAVGSGAKLYVATHVFSAGTSLSFDIESDDNAGFTSATSRASVGALTATGSTWTAISGPVTDDYWRVNVTAATGTFSMAVAVGIA